MFVQALIATIIDLCILWFAVWLANRGNRVIRWIGYLTIANQVLNLLFRFIVLAIFA